MNELRVLLANQIKWSKKTFGDGLRTLGIARHIEKELEEVRANPEDLSEWIDIILLAMDGYWRHGGTPQTLFKHLAEKQQKNFLRAYPFPVSQDLPSEHIKNV